MIEVIIAIVVAAIGIFVLASAFSGASTGSKKHVTTEPKEKAKKQNNKPKETKKAKAAKAREEAEIARLVASEGSSVSGMPTDKQKVVSLEDTQKKSSPLERKSSANRASPVVTTKQRIVDAEQGFTQVEKKKNKPASPIQDKEDAGKDMDRDLSKFFRQADKRGKDKKGGQENNNYKKEDSKKDKAVTGRVAVSQKFTENPTDLWAQGKKWE